VRVLLAYGPAVAFLQLRQGGSTMPIFERTPKKESKPKTESAPKAESAPRIEIEPTASPEPSPDTLPDVTPTSPESHTIDLSRVGEHVAAVLGAAETSANKIREQAEQDRDRLHQQTSQMVDETLAAAARAKQAAEADAQRFLDEAQTAARTTRAEAERYAEERRRDAEIQAAVLIREGEERAAATGDLARTRHAVLLADLEATETRMRDLVTGLRGVAVKLEQVLGGGTAIEPLSGDGSGSLDATLAQRVAEGQAAGAAEG